MTRLLNLYYWMTVKYGCGALNISYERTDDISVNLIHKKKLINIVCVYKIVLLFKFKLLIKTRNLQGNKKNMIFWYPPAI